MTKPVAFVLASTQHGPIIVNRLDYRILDENRGYGVGFQLLRNSVYESSDGKIFNECLKLRRKIHGDEVVAADVGANIGIHTIDMANLMTDWGEVYAFEAQDKIFYALAGNVVLNNCMNVKATHAAVGAESGTLNIPQPDYTRSASFGSLELRQGDNNEFIGQKVSYDEQDTTSVNMVTLDNIGFSRLDFIKVDVEGMEVEVLNGARQVLRDFKPIIFIEIIKSDRAALLRQLADFGYSTIMLNMNVLAIHDDDPCKERITAGDNAITFTR